MPIYEFYCSGCNTLYNFLSKRIDTETRPDCPSCKNIPLERRVAIFATARHRDGDEESIPDDFDEQRMERAMEALAREAEGIDEENPRQAADLMRKLSDMTGIRLKPGMEEALRRMEQGEDIEQIESEMGDIFEDEDPFEMNRKSSRINPYRPPRIDGKLYEM